MNIKKLNEELSNFIGDNEISILFDQFQQNKNKIIKELTKADLKNVEALGNLEEALKKLKRAGDLFFGLTKNKNLTDTAKESHINQIKEQLTQADELL